MGNNTAKSITMVMLSNITSVIAGVVTAFIIPKILPVEGYGYFKTFTLYTGYMGLLNLGIADGIVLEYGGYNYDQLERYYFRAYFKEFTSLHLVLCGTMLIVGLVVRGDIGFIWGALGINTFFSNSVGYFQQISQITQRFKELSLRKILQSISGIMATLILYLYWRRNGQADYKGYIIILLVLSAVLSGWFIHTYREIVFGSRATSKEISSTILRFIKIGFPLVFANLCSTLILSLDRQFVNVLFSTTEYAVYAFAYNMLALVTVATSAISTVLFPAMKRTSVEALKDNYATLIGAIQTFVFGALAVYFPLNAFINWFLPKYSDSLEIFCIIFPGMAISSCVTVVMHNYYKVLGENLIFFKKCIVVLIVSCLANGIAYYRFNTMESISIASIIVMLFWYIFAERYIIKRFQIKNSRNFVYLILVGICFYATATLVSSLIVGCLLYIGLFAMCTILFQKSCLRVSP